MTTDQTRLLKAAALAIAAFLLIIGGFLSTSSFDTTKSMWGVGWALIALVLLLDVVPLGGMGSKDT
jgi:hypothetical protein